MRVVDLVSRPPKMNILQPCFKSSQKKVKKKYLILLLLDWTNSGWTMHCCSEDELPTLRRVGLRRKLAW